MHRHGTDLIKTYNQFNGSKLKEVQLYIDPQEGKLHADVVLDNGARIPLLVDVDPNWELGDFDGDAPLDLEAEHQTAMKAAAAERQRWEGTNQ